MDKRKTRSVLVILSNRHIPSQKPRYFELKCDDKGEILKETRLKAAPRRAAFDEVWENDDGKSEVSSCHRIKRKYGHALESASRSCVKRPAWRPQGRVGFAGWRLCGRGAFPQFARGRGG